MTATLSNWTLEIQGINNSQDMAEYNKEETLYSRKAMKVVSCVVIGFSLYDFIYSAIYDFYGIETTQIIYYTIFVNFFPIILFGVFFIVLPIKDISFTGIGFIPICIYVILETEFNIAYYEMCDINCLYAFITLAYWSLS